MAWYNLSSPNWGKPLHGLNSAMIPHRSSHVYRARLCASSDFHAFFICFLLYRIARNAWAKGFAMVAPLGIKNNGRIIARAALNPLGYQTDKYHRISYMLFTFRMLAQVVYSVIAITSSSSDFLPSTLTRFSLGKHEVKIS